MYVSELIRKHVESFSPNIKSIAEEFLITRSVWLA